MVGDKRNAHPRTTTTNMHIMEGSCRNQPPHPTPLLVPRPRPRPRCPRWNPSISPRQRGHAQTHGRRHGNEQNRHASTPSGHCSAATRSPLAPRELADELDISTASTTKLLDRLERSGHLTRVPHPADRRSVTIQATDHAHTEVKDRLAPMHRDMEEIIYEFTPENNERSPCSCTPWLTSSTVPVTSNHFVMR